MSNYSEISSATFRSCKISFKNIKIPKILRYKSKISKLFLNYSLFYEYIPLK